MNNKPCGHCGVALMLHDSGAVVHPSCASVLLEEVKRLRAEVDRLRAFMASRQILVDYELQQEQFKRQRG